MAWMTTLRSAREGPAGFIGTPEFSHLRFPISSALEMVWGRHVFSDPVSATVKVSPTRCHTRCWCGPMVRDVARLIEWQETDILLRALWEAHRRLTDGSGRTSRRYASPTFSVGAFGCPLYLAERGLLGVRTEKGLWCQAYERGWPTTPPFPVEDSGGVGLLIAFAGDAAWFPGLPYTLETATRAVPEKARPHTTVEWHAEDDLLPVSASDPEGLTWQDQIYRWL